MQKQTLLFLGVALVVVAFVSYVLLSDKAEDGRPDDTTGTSSPSLPSDDAPLGGIETATYEGDTFGVGALSYPREGWTVLATTTAGVAPKLNVYPIRSADERAAELPYTHFSNESHVSVYPEGIPTEGLFADRAPFDLGTSFPVREDTATVYTLEDGTPFAAYVQPTLESIPDSWEEWGFVWVRARIDGMSTYCTRDGVEISEQECDPLASNDEVHYRGSVRLTEWERATQILRTLELTSSSDTVDDAVRVEVPGEGALVQSPLTVRGAARGPWYFEATLPMELVTDDGTVLVEGFAEAQGSWMTEDFVPFETELTFDVPSAAETGVLRIRKANPSGLPQNEASFEVPVRF